MSPSPEDVAAQKKAKDCWCHLACLIGFLPLTWSTRKRKPQLRTTPCHLLDVLYTLHCSFWKEKEREASDAQKKAEDNWGVVRLMACDWKNFCFPDFLSFCVAKDEEKARLAAVAAGAAGKVFLLSGVYAGIIPQTAKPWGSY